MVGFNSKKQLKYCDLQCYACEGFMLKECLMNSDGYHMRMLMILLRGNGTLLDTFKAKGFWATHRVVDAKILGLPEKAEFPVYKYETEH